MFRVQVFKFFAGLVKPDEIQMSSTTNMIENGASYKYTNGSANTTNNVIKKTNSYVNGNTVVRLYDDTEDNHSVKSIKKPSSSVSYPSL